MRCLLTVSHFTDGENKWGSKIKLINSGFFFLSYQLLKLEFSRSRAHTLRKFWASFPGAHRRGVWESVGKCKPLTLQHPTVSGGSPRHFPAYERKLNSIQQQLSLPLLPGKSGTKIACNVYFVFILFTKRSHAPLSQNKVVMTSSYTQHLMNKSIVYVNPIILKVREIKSPRASLTSELWEVPDYITGYLSK